MNSPQTNTLLRHIRQIAAHHVPDPELDNGMDRIDLPRTRHEHLRARVRCYRHLPLLSLVVASAKTAPAGHPAVRLGEIVELSVVASPSRDARARSARRGKRRFVAPSGVV